MSDLGNLLAFHTSPLELIVRGSAMYWFLLLIFRFVLRRDPGSLGVADILFVVIVADAAQNGMSGSYDTLAEGFVLVGTLAGWNYLLDWAGYRWPAIHKLTEPPPLVLVKNGVVQRRNLRREFITTDDLQSELRQAGISDIRLVRLATMEGDGTFSVVRHDDAAPPAGKQSSSLPGGS
jgi:uncharacterized membrane protein YcaP (DUF421 family)